MKHPLTRYSVLALIILLTSFFAAAVAQPCHAQPIADKTFSIIWITDTQYLSENFPAYFDNLTQWIVNNKNMYNVQMVIHTGDIVNDEANSTEWANANQSMSTLLNNGIPYCWDAGNHDYSGSTWIGNQFAAFNPKVTQAEPYWVGNDSDGMDTAVHFSYDGQDWLIVNIAYHASNSALSWANSILDQYPNAHAIVATHAFIDQQCQCDSWALNLQKTVLDTHANVFLTLNGHYHPATPNRTEVGGRYELFFNQQDVEGDLGADAARILTFDVAKGTIQVQTYDQFSNQFLSDPGNNFTLTTNFRNDAAGVSVPEFPLGGLIAVSSLGEVACLVCFCKRHKLRVF